MKRPAKKSRARHSPPTRRAKGSAVTRARPGEGNPSWCRSYVTKSFFLNWKAADDKTIVPKGPVTFTAGPGEPGKRVTRFAFGVALRAERRR
jgi:hypothetical protein